MSFNGLYSTNNSNSIFNNFKSNKYVEGTKDFLDSNSLIAKLSFLLLVIIIFIILLRLGVSFISWLFTPSSSPTLINGMIDGKELNIISQDPSSSSLSTQINRSSNKKGGIEFTWSTWLFIDDITYRQGQYRHIFHKGNDNINITNSPTGMNFPNNAPGLYLAPNSNSIIVVMNTFNDIVEEVRIDNIPIKKWVNIIIRCNGNILDIFVNGTLTRRHILTGVAKQNYGDVYVSMNGGFSGYTSSLRYFNKSIGVREIEKIISDGPNTKLLSSSDIKKSKPPYLSLRWYFMGNNDEIYNASY
jgi:hypothetical protein